MPRTTVAQLEERVNELQAQLDQALHVNAYQTRALADVIRSNKEAHAALDRARQAFQELKGSKQPAPKKTTTKRTAPKTTQADGIKQYACNVPGTDHPETFHTAAELRQCWMNRK